MRIKVDQHGQIHAVYSDRLRELGLGPMEISRASNVEFNHKTQQWEAHTPSGELIAKGPNRDEVIQNEIKVLESRL